jgi:hypothetical protein
VRQVLAEGTLPVPAIAPGRSGQLRLEPPDNAAEADVLALRVDDPSGRELWTWSWPMPRADALRTLPNASSRQARFLPDGGEVIRCMMDDVVIAISRQTGLLQDIESGGTVSLNNGPRPVTGSFRFTGIETNTIGGDVIVRAAYEGALRTVVWRLRSDRWLECHYEYEAFGSNAAAGVTFDYPEDLVTGKRWLGDGPYRVWQNRQRGVRFGLWENDYNDTITGYSQWEYPEFKGCFATVYWMELVTGEGRIVVVPESSGFVQVLTPGQPPMNLQGHTGFVLPECGLALLDAIPPVGSKFKPAESTGPQGHAAAMEGVYSGTVRFRFAPR